MKYTLPIPAQLTSAHLKDARLFANRDEMMVWLASRPFDRVAEVGVAYGDFSVHMMAALKPKEFHAFDLFNLETYPIVLGMPSAVRLAGRTHLEFYAERFPGVKMWVGDSSTNMNLQPEKSYDLIYIDGAHIYEGVKKDTDASLRTIKDDGVLVFNDYIPHDPLTGHDYGVMQVVNDLCVNQGWRMTALALQPLMFCDVVLVRG